MKLFYSIIFLFCLLANVSAQDRCSHSHHYMQELLTKELGTNGGDLNLSELQKQSIKDWKKSKSSNSRSFVPVIIPVHVVIQHAPGQAIGTGDNLSIERIQSQIDVMNEDFSGTNSGFASVPNEFDTGMSEISFCMASVDPDGNPTDGITRFASNMNWETNNFTIMEQTIWDRDQYLNIYVTPSIEGLGISPVPSTAYNIPELYDAPAVLTDAFGGPGYATIQQYDLGRTAVHEIGHWLGLSHVWGPNSGGCNEDDGMDDTPIQDEPTYFSPAYPVSDACSNSIMFMNFMDYVDDNTMHAFSQDQVDYMQFIIENVRSGLMSSAATNCSGVGTTPLSASITNVIQNNCWDDANGQISISASGGQPPYSYSLDGINFQASGDFTNLSNGTYTLVVMDENGDSFSVSESITSGPELIAEVVAVTQPCSNQSNGSFGIVGTGGTGALTVLANSMTGDANNFFSDLPAGVYVIEVVDELGCAYIIEYELIDIVDPITVNSIDITSPDCMTGPDGGQVTFDVTSTNPMIVYIMNGVTNSTPVFTGLTAGDYDYEILDGQGCSVEGSLSIDAAAEFQVFTETTDVSCFGEADGIILFEVDGIMGDYTTLFDNEVITESSINDLASGNYILTVQDSEGCVVELVIPVGSPEEIMTSFELFIGDCSNPFTDIEFTASGGTGDLLYTVGNDSNTDGYFVQLEGGSYELIVIDAAGCEMTMTFDIPEIELLELELLGTSPMGCAGDSTGVIEAIISGGVGPFSYELNGNSVDGPIFENLAAGDYEVLVIDADGCVSEAVYTLPQGSSISLDISVDEGDCDAIEGNGLTVAPDGGTPPYTLIVNGNPQTTFTLTDLSNGDYEVEVIDDQGCSTGIQTVEVQGAAPIDIVVNSQSDVSCNGRADGSLNYSFDTNAGITSIITIPDGTNFNSLTAGTYTIQVTNTDGCTAELIFDITEPDELLIADEELVAAGNLAGSASFTMSGGTPPFNFVVDGVENEDGIFSLLQGDYTLRVTDANGCMLFHDFTIELESSIDELNSLNLEIYPNPVSNFLHIDCQECSSSANYRILGIDGQILRTSNNIQEQIELKDMPLGILLLEVTDGLKTSTMRIIKN